MKIIAQKYVKMQYFYTIDVILCNNSKNKLQYIKKGSKMAKAIQNLNTKIETYTTKLDQYLCKIAEVIL